MKKKSLELFGLIDIGFDGEVLIPQDIYNHLNLYAFEYSLDVISIAETASGEQLRLKTASAAVKIKGLDLTLIVTINSHEKCREVLIGRKFLESFYLTLMGSEKELTIAFEELEEE